jgi:hypothetical protein
MTAERPGPPPDDADARRAVRFILVKAAIFILIPALAAAVAVMLTLK